MSIAGSSSIRRLKDVAVVVHLHDLAPVGGQPASGRDRRRFERFAARRGIALLPDVADRQSREGFPQRVVRREDSVIAMPVPPRLWDEIRKPGRETQTA